MFLSTVTSITVLLTIMTPAALGQTETFCRTVPEKAPKPAPAIFCEYEKSISLTMGNAHHEFDRTEYIASIHHPIAMWLTINGLWPLTYGQEITLWLSVPEINPEATQARAVLPTPKGDLVFFLPALPNDPLEEPMRVGLYPEGYGTGAGYVAGELLITYAHDYPKDRLLHWLERIGLEVTSWSGNQQARIAVRPLFEKEAQHLIMVSGANDWIEKIEVNALYEWIAFRSPVMTFSFDDWLAAEALGCMFPVDGCPIPED